MSRHDIRIAILWLVLFFVMVSSNIPAPLYEIYAISLHFSTVIQTSIFSTYVLTYIPSMLFAGKWSDHNGRKNIISIGLILAIFGSLFFIFSNSVINLFIARALQGIASGFIAGPASAMILESNDNKKYISILIATATSGGTAIGPLIGGFVFQYLPYRFILIYLLSILWLILMSLLFPSIEETGVKLKKKFQSKSFKIPKEVMPFFIISSISAFIVWSITAFYMSLSSTFIFEYLHITNVAVSGLIVFLMLATAVIVQVTVRSKSELKMIITGLILSMIGLAGITFAGNNSNFPFFILSTILAGIGQGLVFPGSVSIIASGVPVNRKAEIMSAFYVVVYIGVGLPVILISVVSSYVNLFVSMEIYSAIVLLLVAITLAFIMKHRNMFEKTAV